MMIGARVWRFGDPEKGGQAAATSTTMADTITIRIGDEAFDATLSDNATAAAFKKLLPLSITMKELNGNEKFGSLSRTLPTHASRPSSIRTGDLMLYGSDTLVLFYKSFQTSYTYTNIGRVDEPARLAAAIDAGSPSVSFEVKRRTD